MNAPQPVSSLAELEPDQVETAMDVWRERMRTHAEGSAYVHLIVNEGREAGASLPHTHAQLYALPFVPAAVARERERFTAYFERTQGRNLLEDLLQEEVRRRERIVSIDREAVAICPFAARVPFQIQILPRRPRARFEDDGPLGRGAAAPGARPARARARRGAAAEPVGAHRAPRGGELLLADRRAAAADPPGRPRAGHRREPEHHAARASRRASARRVIAIVAVIVAATVAGYGAEFRYRSAAEALARRLMWTVLWVLMPFVAFFNIASLHIDARVGAGIGFAWIAIAVTLAIAWFLGTRVLHLPRPSVGALMGASVFGNTAFLGLPFTVALFGFDELGHAVAYDNLVSTPAFVTIGFSIGAAFGAIGGNVRERAIAFLTRNPPLWATLAGLAAPAALAPDLLVDASRLLALAILPIGFFAVGVTLAAETVEGAARFPPRLDVPVACAVGLKLVVPPLIVLGLSRAVIDVPDVYLSQAAMASAINNLVVAHEYELDRGLVAAAIAWSTAIVVPAGAVLALV